MDLTQRIKLTICLLKRPQGLRSSRQLQQNPQSNPMLTPRRWQSQPLLKMYWEMQDGLHDEQGQLSAMRSQTCETRCGGQEKNSLQLSKALTISRTGKPAFGQTASTDRQMMV